MYAIIKSGTIQAQAEVNEMIERYIFIILETHIFVLEFKCGGFMEDRGREFFTLCSCHWS